MHAWTCSTTVKTGKFMTVLYKAKGIVAQMLCQL